MIGKKGYSAKLSDIKRKWVLVDAESQILGRFASSIAHRLRGKHRAIFTPHLDCGDYIVVVNASKIAVTGKKRSDKIYYRYTGYVGNMKSFTFEQLLEKSPEKVLRLAVKGMLPRGPLGREMLRKLKIYSGSAHPHEAQNPEPSVF